MKTPTKKIKSESVKDIIINTAKQFLDSGNLRKRILYYIS